MREKLQRFMTGRYGGDEFGKALNATGLVLLLVSIFFRGIPFLCSLCYWAALAILIYDCYRMFSKNIAKRYEENQKFRNFRYNMVIKKEAQKKHFAQRKTHRFFKCPQCGQKVRVPKGRGKICITCPKCRCEFVKKS